MNSTEVFDILLDKRKITLATSSRDANVLRVAVLRKFKDYKEQMDRLGFLDPTLEECSVSLEYDEEKNIAKLFLRPRKRSSLVFTIIEETDPETGDTQ
jgi:hypothetical protein